MSTTTMVGTPDPDGPPDPFVNVVPIRRTTPAGDAAATPTDTATPGTAVERKVFDAEIVSVEDSAALDRRMAARLAVGAVRVPGKVVRFVATSPTAAPFRYRVRRVPRDTITLGFYALRGHWRWLVKAWNWATYADLRADARQAKQIADKEARRAAQEMIRADAVARWARAGTGLHRITATAAVAAPVAVALTVTAALFERSEMWEWLADVYTVLDAVKVVFGWVLTILVVAGPPALLVGAVYEGRDKTPGIGFLTRPDRDDADSWVDERMISVALAHLGIGPLNQFFKGGGQLEYSVPARVDGDGTYAQIRLPMGVTADMVAAQRQKLAANLGRSTLETWPTEGSEAGVLDLWVADKGKLNQGAGNWPLLDDGEVDLFEGVPFGRTQRGVLVNAPLIASNWLVGGRPGQGKSVALRTAMLGAALDVTAELWAFVMGENADFQPFAPRLTRYRMGMDDSVAEAATQALRDAFAELQRRGKILTEMGQAKVSRKLALRRIGLHPLVIAIDECHELFQHPEFGTEASNLAIRIIKQGRKYGIVLLLATQSPTKDSIPKDVSRNVSVGVAFSVADHVANDGLLGSGKYRQGVRATDLRTGTDRGTAVAVGLTSNAFELVKVFYVPFDEDSDMVTPVITRAMAQIAEAGREIAATTDTTVTDDDVVADHLADIVEAMQDGRRVRTSLLLRRLAEHNRDVYGDWSYSDLSDALDEHDVKIRKSDGQSVVRIEEVRDALTERDRLAEDDSSADTEDDTPADAGK